MRTIGRFVWEHFTAEHVAGAREAFDVVYSLTHAEQAALLRRWAWRRRTCTWGCHPELIAVADEVAAERREARGERRADAVRYVFPGGFLGHRKPLEPVLEAFEATSDRRLRLIVKAQVERKQVKAAAAAARP